MNNNLTEIIVLLDKSGSMDSCLNDTIGGLNSFIEEQKKISGEVNFTLVQFNHRCETILNSVPIHTVTEQTMRPGGNTALFDAIGETITETGKRLAALPENQRPGLVLFMIITDGEENSSREYKSREQIKKMILHQEQKYSWKFSFLGSNQDGFAAGNAIGIASSATFDNSAPSKAFAATSSKFTRMRGLYNSGNESSLVDNSYTTDEISKMASDSPT